MSKIGDINEDEIRVIGSEHTGSGHKPTPLHVALACCAAAIVLVIVIVIISNRSNDGNTPPSNGHSIETEDISVQEQWLRNDDTSFPAATLRSDTVMDGIRIMLLRPMNAAPKLCVGHIDTNDRSIIFAALAADIRRDNGKIVGAFVCEGEPRAWGVSKKGYCAIIGGNMAIGVADDSPYFERATETGGYFFRQYPAVNQRHPQINNPENKALRRALCSLNGDITIAVSLDRVLMNDFSQALAHLGVDNAIFLIGGGAHGWYVDSQGSRIPLSNEPSWTNPNRNYLYFQKK